MKNNQVIEVIDNIISATSFIYENNDSREIRKLQAFKIYVYTHRLEIFSSCQHQMANSFRLRLIIILRCADKQKLTKNNILTVYFFSYGISNNKKILLITTRSSFIFLHFQSTFTFSLADERNTRIQRFA